MSNPKPWSFVRPKTCNPQEKLFALEQKPYTGKRLNKARIIRPITTEEVQHSLRLSALPAPIPESFSWRKKGDSSYRGKIEAPRDQGGCGSCWAFSIAMALGDRYSIKYGINSSLLSPTWLMSQTYNLMEVKSQDSCNEGGDPFIACKWLEKGNSTKKENCWPYSMISSHKWVSPNKLPEDCCINCCGTQISNQTTQKYSIKPGSTKSLAIISNGKINKNATISAIQKEIMSNGPVITGFQVYDDFMTYWKYGAPKKKIYICDNKGESGGHAVTITGWGVGTESNGRKIRFWEVRNSWGTKNSGDGGYGYIAFSTDVTQNSNLQIDIPQEYSSDPRTGEIEWSGGIFTLSPGPLPPVQVNKTLPPVQVNKTLPPVPKNFSNEYSSVSSSNNENNSSGSNIKIFGMKIPLYLVVIILILLSIVLIYLGYMLFKKNT